MKLSEMGTDKAADVIVAISACVSDIAQDEDVGKAIEKFRSNGGENTTVAEIVSIIAKSIVPLALKKHRANLYTILCTMTEKTLDEIKAQTISQTIEDAKNCFDKDLLTFFSSAAGTGKADA